MRLDIIVLCLNSHASVDGVETDARRSAYVCLILHARDMVCLDAPTSNETLTLIETSNEALYIPKELMKGTKNFQEPSILRARLFRLCEK
jgi:hypothetical protein